MRTATRSVCEAPLSGTALKAWRGYLQSAGVIVRKLDAELLAEHGLTSRNYEALLHLAEAKGEKLAMSTLADRIGLTQSGATRLVDGLIALGLVERSKSTEDARISMAHLTDSGHAKLLAARTPHAAGIQRLFLARFSESELDTLTRLLDRLTRAE